MFQAAASARVSGLPPPLESEPGLNVAKEDLLEHEQRAAKPTLLASSLGPADAWLVTIVQIYGARFPTQTQIEHFNKHREAHGEINVAFWDVNPEAINHERQADQQKETQGKHLDRWMF